MKTFLIAAIGFAALLSACSQSQTPEDLAEERVEEAAEASADVAGPTKVALGLSEAQLLDAELIGPDNVELGDVVSLVRGANGQVERLLVEIEDSNPDRFVHVPVAGLTVISRGNDRDLSTTMTKAQLAALPEVKISAQ